MEKTNQRTEVLKYLQEHGSITSMDAISKFGATRLSAIIFDLRKAGHIIDTMMIEGTTRYGTSCQYGKYIYKGVEE